MEFKAQTHSFDSVNQHLIYLLSSKLVLKWLLNLAINWQKNPKINSNCSIKVPNNAKINQIVHIEKPSLAKNYKINGAGFIF